MQLSVKSNDIYTISNYSSKLDVWMVFCVIFVFGTLLEFALLICLEKQVFEAQIKKSLSNLSTRRRTVKRGTNSKEMTV